MMARFSESSEGKNDGILYLAVTNTGSKYRFCLKNGLNSAVLIRDMSNFGFSGRSFLMASVSSFDLAACFGSVTKLSGSWVLQYCMVVLMLHFRRKV